MFSFENDWGTVNCKQAMGIAMWNFIVSEVFSTFMHTTIIFYCFCSPAPLEEEEEALVTVDEDEQQHCGCRSGSTTGWALEVLFSFIKLAADLQSSSIIERDNSLCCTPTGFMISLAEFDEDLWLWLYFLIILSILILQM